MPALAQHRIRVTYLGGLADENCLPSYDGATSIDGIVRALHIVTHAYMTGEVVSRATALRGASMILKPARQGSFIFDVIVFLEQYPGTTSAAAALVAAPFYDFIKTAFKRATGYISEEPKTSHLANLYKRKELLPLKKPPADLDDLTEMLEGSLQAAHRPIGTEGTIKTISVGSPRKELVSFNDATKDWVNTQDRDSRIEVYQGNVTRYNSISRNGRAFIDQESRVVPFKPDADFPAGDLSHLTWSLHGSNIGAPKQLEMRAKRVNSASGKMKRLLLVDCKRSE